MEDLTNIQTLHIIKENLTEGFLLEFIELDILADYIYDNVLQNKTIISSILKAKQYNNMSHFDGLSSKIFSDCSDLDYKASFTLTTYYFYMKEGNLKKTDDISKSDLKDKVKVICENLLELIFPESPLNSHGIYSDPNEVELILVNKISDYTNKIEQLMGVNKTSNIFPPDLDSSIKYTCEGFEKEDNPRDFYKDKTTDQTSIFYRGVANTQYLCEPSIFRCEQLLSNERDFTQDIVINNAESFKERKTIFEKLVYLQHFETPTRLVDLTQNPLAALYFACEDKFNTDNNKFPGKVEVYFENNSYLKYYDSDVIKLISNLVRLSSSDYSNLKETLSECSHCSNFTKNCETFNKKIDTMKLISLIKTERPSFTGRIKPSDLLSDYIVFPIKDNQRIISQSGLFMICGVTDNTKSISTFRTRYNLQELNGRKTVFYIPSNSKKSIIKELEVFNVNLFSIYPDIPNASNYFKRKYMNRV